MSATGVKNHSGAALQPSERSSPIHAALNNVVISTAQTKKTAARPDGANRASVINGLLGHTVLDTHIHTDADYVLHSTSILKKQ